ncbi:hypothetical protein CU669_10825 [Paramagnetospirillum kuznetsovii]|uniref:DUF2786 domain-containing protein n=1 Tax=Paramagnetospirillum kuznetsovii TaxID=2053833 RepID=A0A364NXL2_9PROT|nr:DUF2786 domain-containing protein [Paramagnetospirillum kuznetsovii]RAU21793.1 hypothetical protein CU669_10825 [Paramagnetospirillum kuznetsovii]
MSADDRAHSLARLRALMAMTTVNGCTEEEELSAARKVAKLIEQLDGQPGQSVTTDPSWAARERDNPQYQALLEKTTQEGLLKAALQELALGHINTVSPLRRNTRGQAVEHVSTVELLRPYFNMMLGSAGASRLARGIVDDILAELIYDGLLPDVLAIPRG